jgi:hypothetical protein
MFLHWQTQSAASKVKYFFNYLERSGGGSFNYNVGELKTDEAGNIYAIVKIEETVIANNTSYIFKFDSQGTFIWQKSFPYVSGDTTGQITTSGLCIDGNQNVYVAYPTVGNGTLGYVNIVKFNINGSQVWAKNYNIWPTNGLIANVYDMACDGNGTVYIVCDNVSPMGATRYEGALLKIDNTGAVQWYVSLYDGIGSQNLTYTNVRLDGSGNVYIKGTRTGSPSGNLIIKYDSSGSVVFQKSVPTSVTQIEVSKSGNIYLAYFGNQTIGGSLRSVVTIAQYDTSMTTASWSKSIYKLASSLYYSCFPYDISVDSTGNVYVSGYFQQIGVSTANEAGIIKMSSSGAVSWSRQIDVTSKIAGTSYDFSEMRYIDLDTNNDICCFVRITDSAGSNPQRNVVVRLPNNGTKTGTYTSTVDANNFVTYVYADYGFTSQNGSYSPTTTVYSVYSRTITSADVTITTTDSAITGRYLEI